MCNFSKVLLAILVLLVTFIVTVPAFACEGCGRASPDGVSFYSIQMENNLLSFTADDAIPASAATPTGIACTLAIVGYDTGDEKGSSLAIKRTTLRVAAHKTDKGAITDSMQGGTDILRGVG